MKKQVGLFLLTTLLTTLTTTGCTFLQSSNITGMGMVGSCRPDGKPNTGYLKINQFMGGDGSSGSCAYVCTATGPSSSKIESTGGCGDTVIHMDAETNTLQMGKVEYSTSTDCTGPFSFGDPSAQVMSLTPRLNQAELPFGFFAFNGVISVNNVPLPNDETEFGIFYCGASLSKLYYLDLEDGNSSLNPKAKTVNPSLSWSAWLQHPTIQQFSQSPTTPMLTGQTVQPELWFEFEYFTP